MDNEKALAQCEQDREDFETDIDEEDDCCDYCDNDSEDEYCPVCERRLNR